MSMDLTNKVSRLPDYYDKTEGESNNWKILELSREAKQDFKDVLDDIRSASAIGSASGSALDVWGSIYGILRDGDSDEVFRMRIQIQQLRDKVQVDYSSWYRTILEIFQCRPEQLVIESSGHPFGYRFSKFPYSRCNEIGLDVEKAEKMIIESLPVTADLETIIINHWSNIANYSWTYTGRYTWDDVLHSSAFRT